MRCAVYGGGKADSILLTAGGGVVEEDAGEVAALWTDIDDISEALATAGPVKLLLLLKLVVPFVCHGAVLRRSYRYNGRTEERDWWCRWW